MAVRVGDRGRRGRRIRATRPCARDLRRARHTARHVWTNPILVDAEAGIIAGHGRLLAARELGMTTVPVIELPRLTEAQRRAYVIADNRLALDAGWDEDLLTEELRALEDSSPPRQRD